MAGEHKAYDSITQLLDQLRTRDLTSEEWASLRRRAEDDPFLADALDGLQALPRGVRARHLQSLTDQINKRTQKRRIPVIRIAVSVAAAVLLLLGFFWLLPGDSGEYVTTAQAPTPESTENPVATAGTLAAKSDAEAPVVDAVVSSDEQSLSSSRARSDNALADNSGAQRDDLQIIAEPKPATPPPSVPLAMAEADVATGESVSRKEVIVESADEPPGYDRPAVGNLKDAEDRSPKDDAVSTVALSRQSAPAQKAAPSGQTSEGYQALQSSTDNAGAGTVILAQPADGQKSYEKYIRKNLKYPEAAEAAGIHGIVKLQFQVDEDGHPFDIRILESVGYGCDEEAIRLISEGPAWSSPVLPATGQWEIAF